MKNKVFEIFDLAMKITNKTCHTVFVDYSGHINHISVRVFEGGWGEEKDPDMSIYFEVSENEKIKADFIIQYLEKLLRNKSKEMSL